jgi:exoribonuclease R
MDKWIGKHPIGVITETIGDVSILEFYYEYQMNKYRLNDSITNFTNKTRRMFANSDENLLISKIVDNNKFIKNRLDYNNIITIDPNGCVDIDDGFSCQTNCETGITTISIYISNVYAWISTFDLWNDITRVSTIYLPDKRRTMLPPILSDNLCSLVEKQHRVALCMDVFISRDGQVIGEPRFENAVICVKKNYSYDSPKMIQDPDYTRAFEITRKINPNVKDSHALIEYWMVFMNSECGKRLSLSEMGIFRTASFEERRSFVFDNPNTQNFFNNWGNVNSEYSIKSARHELLDLASYAQITSPIRRLVDLINQCQFIKLTNQITEESDKFVDLWLRQIDKLNMKMKSIRRVQNDCEIMNICYNTPGLSDNGIVFDQTQIDDGYKYNVYLENLKLISEIRSNEPVEIYSKHKFRIFLFEDESSKNRKIQLEIITT